MMSISIARKFLPTLAAALACLCVQPAGATPITFGFSGSVTQTNFDPDDPFGGAIAFGSPISGSYTFDSTAPDLIADPNTASYQASGAPFGVLVSVAGGALVIDNAVLALNIANDIGAGVDQYGLFSGSPLLNFQSLRV